MTIIGIDDTDSRTQGMCTTYVGHRIADELRNEYDATVSRVLLTRLNPAAKHKTRGNASVSIHTDASKEDSLAVVEKMLEKFSIVDDDNTNPGAVITDMDEIPEEVSDWTNRAMHTLLDISEAKEIIEKYGFDSIHYGNGRGRIGSLAGLGAWDAFDDWTYEHISYRHPEVRGTERDVDAESVFTAADEYHPQVWDTVDRTAGDIVCVPHTPCPILHGIRGDVEEAVESVSKNIESEPVESRQTFMTNQGTDVHLEDAQLEDVVNDSAYTIEGIVKEAPETRKGGHVFFEVKSPRNPQETIKVAAFEPTKHFRPYVRDLKEGDVLTLCGGVTDGTLKLEKFAVHEMNDTKLENPQCDSCDRSMGSMGADQGYRCRSCGHTEPSKIEVPVERKLERGWYEVPPCARRHISKPLIRSDYEMETHPLV
jgi:tRNA(Ile2)-agmatinylcytidine synthase